jgi:hypothetical protein
MPNFDWQLIVALLAVAAAGLFLIRRALRLLQSSRESGRACGSCGACPTGSPSSAAAPSSFVPLETLSRRSDDKKTHPVSN